MTGVAELTVLLPEILLFAAAIGALLSDFRGQRPRLSQGIALLGVVAALAAVLSSLPGGATTAFSRSVVTDPLSQYFKLLLILGAMATILLIGMSREVKGAYRAETQALVLLASVGMCIVASATHFLLLFLAYEVTSVALYAMVTFSRRSELASEAGVKLFFHGALTSVLMVFGIVLIYGTCGSFNILDIHARLGELPAGQPHLWVAYGLVFGATAFRMALFPFHFLLPDLVQGAPSPAAAFVSVSPPLVGAAFALRLSLNMFSTGTDDGWKHLPEFNWPALVAILAAISMTVGNLTALYQRNLKRLIAYASVAQVGGLLMGLAVATRAGVASLLFALAVSTLVILGAYFVIQLVTDHEGSEDIAVLRGLVWRNPFEGVALCVFLLSLAGLPPLAGFVGRFYLIGAVVREKLYWLSVVGAANWVIGVAHVLALCRQVFAAPAGQDRGPVPALAVMPVARVAVLVMLLPTIALGVYWDPLMERIADALATAKW